MPPVGGEKAPGDSTRVARFCAAPAARPQRLSISPHVIPKHRRAAGAQIKEGSQQREECCFPGAVRSHDAKDLAMPDVEINPRHRMGVAKLLAEMGRCDGLAHTLRPSVSPRCREIPLNSCIHRHARLEDALAVIDGQLDGKHQLDAFVLHMDVPGGKFRLLGNLRHGSSKIAFREGIDIHSGRVAYLDFAKLCLGRIDIGVQSGKIDQGDQRCPGAYDFPELNQFLENRAGKRCEYPGIVEIGLCQLEAGLDGLQPCPGCLDRRAGFGKPAGGGLDLFLSECDGHPRRLSQLQCLLALRDLLAGCLHGRACPFIGGFGRIQLLSRNDIFGKQPLIAYIILSGFLQVSLGLLQPGSCGPDGDTIRYYEREGLLPKPERTQAGYRLYRLETLNHLTFIKRAQALGFTLSEIRDLLGGCHDAEACNRVERLLEQKIGELDQKVQEIQALRTVLSTYLVICKDALASGRAKAGCPVLSDIASRPRTTGELT